MQNALRGRMDRDYTILIIDDEPLARYSFRNLIAGRFQGFSVVGEADTGPQGLEMFSRFQPDIVMMDIQIPDLNGLETSRLILERYPGAQIIILSAYDQFDYVQDAINFGVLGYLLKPVQEKKLSRLLDLAVENINAFGERRKNQEQLRSYRDIAEADMISSFIYGSCGGLDASFYAGLMDPKITSGFFAVFRPDMPPAEVSQLSNDLNAFLKHLPGCTGGRWIGGVAPVFIRGEAENSSVLIESIARRLQVLTGGVVRWGVGEIQKISDDFSLSFRQAMDAMEYGSMSGDLHEFEYSRSLESSFLAALKTGSSDEAIEILNRFFRELSLPGISLRDSQISVTEFLIQIKRFTEDQGDSRSARQIGNLIRDIPLRTERLELVQWISGSLSDYIEIQQNSQDTEDLQIRKILKYIDLNDFREISLDTTALSVGLTPQYVSKIFKDKYKMNFLEYLITRRMELACRLLIETDMTVRAIASEVGYTDINYFGKVFRKSTGMSPRDYRLSH